MRIIDLDNCIADDAWRVPTIDYGASSPSRRYHRYHSLAPWDRCDPGDLLRGTESIAILTARPTLYREATEEWLKRNGVRYAHLMMRPNSDHRPSVELKLWQVKMIREHYSVRLEGISVAYDDRPEIVDMYRSLGINAKVRAIHLYETAS